MLSPLTRIPADVRRIVVPIVVTFVIALGAASLVGLVGTKALGVIGVCGLAFVVFLHPPAAAWTMISVAPFIIGFPRGQFVPEMRLNEPLLAILALTLAAHGLFKPGSMRIQWKRFDLVIVMITIAGAFLPLAFHIGRLRPLDGSDFQYAMAPVKMCAAYFVCRFAITNERDLDIVLKLGLASASVVSLIAVADSMNIGNFAYTLANYIEGGFVVDDGRGGSTFGNPIGMGVYATINALIALSYLATGRGGPVLTRLAFGCCMAGVIGSGQVTALFALTVGTATYLFINRGALQLLRRLAPMLAIAVIVLWPLIDRRLNGFEGYGVTSEQRNAVELAEPRDQPEEIWLLDTGSSWNYRWYNLKTYFLPEFEHTRNILFGVQPEARVAGPGGGTDFIWIESGYLWLFWIGGVPYAVAFIVFIWSGIHYYRKVALARRGEFMGKIAGTCAAFVAVVGVVQAFDPHLTLRGTSDLMYPLLGASAFMLRDLDFPKGTALDRRRAEVDRQVSREPAELQR